MEATILPAEDVSLAGMGSWFRLRSRIWPEVGEIRDESAEGRLYILAEAQGGYLNAQQAIEAGVPRSTLTYHAREGGTLERSGMPSTACVGSRARHTNT